MAYTELETNAEANSASSNGHSRKDDDTLAGGYIKALSRGEKPVRPDVGQWSRLCDTLDIVKGDATAVQNALNSRGIHKQYPGLAALLNPSLARLNTPLPHLEDGKNKGEGYPPLPQGVALDPALARGASPLRDEYVEHSKKVSPEGYIHFHEMCFWVMLSFIAARRVKIAGEIPIFTNLYGILAAKSGEYKKSTTANVAYRVLQSAGLEWLLGAKKTTPQKLIYDMAGTLPKDFADLDYDKQERLRQKLTFAGQRGWMYGEFGKFLQSVLKKDSVMSEFADIFLLMDDCEEIYDAGTISRGDEIVDRPYLSVLGCMTPASARGSARSGSDLWSDGFWARCVFVCPPESNADDDTDEIDSPFTFESVEPPRNLIKKLKEWHQRLGIPQVDISPILDKKGEPTGRYTTQRGEFPETPILFSQEAQGAWKRYRKALKAIQKKMRNPDLESSYARIPMIALRIAALAASLENHDRIELPQWALAQEMAEIWRESLHNLYAQVNTAGHSETRTLEKLIEDIFRRKQEEEKQKGNDLPVHMDARELMRSSNRLNSLPRGAKQLHDLLRSLVAVGILAPVPGAKKYMLAHPLQGVQDTEQRQVQELDLEMEADTL